jgi:hypothetical protein
MFYQNPAIRSRIKLWAYWVEQAKGGPSKLLLSFLFVLLGYCAFKAVFGKQFAGIILIACLIHQI